MLTEPSGDASEIVADSAENDVGGIAGTAFEVAAPEVTFGLQVSAAGECLGAVIDELTQRKRNSATLLNGA